MPALIAIRSHICIALRIVFICANFLCASVFTIRMDELKAFNLDRLYTKLSLPDDQFIKWLQHLGLLHRTRTCICGAQMRQREPKSNHTYGNWRCPKRECRKERGFLADTWFQYTQMTLKEVSLYYEPCSR
jgi:hypothetical protein